MPLLPASGYATPSAPTVEPSPVPGTPYQDIRAPLEAFGGATAQALSGLGTSLEKTAGHLENIQQFYDQVVVDEQKNSYENKVNNKLHGDPSVAGDVGYMGLQGKNALEAREGVRRDIDAMLSEHRSTLKNANQLRLFDQDASRYRNYALNSVGRHYDEQYNKHAAETADSTLKLKLHEGTQAANNNDFGRMRTSLESALVASEQALRLRGADDATIALHRAKTVEAFTVTWAVNAIERNAPEGKQFVLDHKNELGDKYDELLHRATTASTQYDVERMKNGLPPVTSQPNLVRGGATQTRISEEATKSGFDPATILAFADIESSMGRNLGRRGNIFQLGTSEWSAAGGGKLGDIETDIKNGLIDIKKREADLTVALGRKPEGWELYLAHQQGVGGAISLLTNPNTPAGNLVRDPSHISGNGGDPNAPASQFVAKTRALFENRRARYSGGGAPAQPSPTAGSDTVPSPTAPVAGDTRADLERKDRLRQQDPYLGLGPSGGGVPATPEAGVQTLARDLRRQAAGSGEPLTIRGLAAANATPDTVGAKVDVAVKHTGFGPDQPLDLSKPEVMTKTLEAITLARTGKLTSEDKQVITRAVSMKSEDVATPTVVQPPGSPMPALPPNEPGELPDGEVPGLLEKLKQGAKLLPPGAKPEVWNAYVRSVRQDANMAYQQQMHGERQRAIAQQTADREIGDKYYERIAPGSTNMPSEAEVLKDTRISQEKRKDIINVMHALNKRDPDPAVANNNMVEAYKGLGLPEGNSARIYRKEQIDKLYTDKQITWDMRRELQSHLETQQGAKQQYVQPRITQLLKDAERVLFPLKHMTGGVGLQMDPDAPMRERRYQNFVENTVQDYITQGKDVRKLFDPGSPDKPNPEYLGNRALLDEFGKGAKQFGRGQASTVYPGEGELKTNPDIMKAYREGRFGVFGSPEALEAAKQYSIKAGLGGRRQPVPETGVPMR